MTTAVLRRSGPLPLMNPLTLVIALAAVMLGAAILFNFSTTSEPMAYLILLGYVQLVPVVISISRRHMNYISFMMANHFLALTFPKYIEFNDIRNLQGVHPSVLTAMYEQAICSVIMIVIYTVVRASLFREGAAKERFQLLTLQRKDLLMIGLAMAVMPLIVPYLPPTAGALQFLVLSAALIMVFTCVSKGNEWLIAAFKVLAIIVSFEHFIRTGMLSLFGMVVGLWALTSFLRKNYRGIVFCVVCVGIGSAIQSVKADYRVVIRENSGLSHLARVEILSNFLGAKYFDEELVEGDRSEALTEGLMRIGDDSLERVIRMTPSEVPFWEGETYITIPTMFIPRIIWPDKPERNFWNKYGRTYKVLSSDDFQTSVGVGYLAEAYMNFGWTGLYIVAALVGVVAACAERATLLVLRDFYFFSFVLPLTVLMAPGGDLGSLLNSLWMITLFLAIVRIPMKRMAQRDYYQ